MRHREQFEGFLFRHFLTLIVQYELQDGTPKLAHYSGIFAQWRSQFCFLTAGHCIEEVENLGKYGYRLIGTNLMDFGHVQFPPLPFTYDSVVRRFVNIEDGLDVGVIEIKEPIANALIRNGAIPVRQLDVKEPDDEMEVGVLAGIPTEWREFLPRGPMINMRHPLAFFPVHYKRTETGADGLPQHRFSIDLERVDYEGKHLEDLAGLSGGPVYGFWKLKSGQYKAHPLGFQVGWYQSPEREINVTPLSVFFGILEGAELLAAEVS